MERIFVGMILISTHSVRLSALHHLYTAVAIFAYMIYLLDVGGTSELTPDPGTPNLQFRRARDVTTRRSPKSTNTLASI